MFRTLALSVLLLSSSLAQVVVNELLSANTQSTPDVVDFEDYPDWIELRNTTASAVSLSGYFLSDDPGNPFKWPVPATASIPANGYLLVWADGHDAAPGQTHPRGYWPWRNFTTEGYHTNFSLSADGEAVVLTKATGSTSTELIRAATPVPVAPATVAVWKYKDDGSDQSTQWQVRSFVDSGWASGPAKLGYGDSGMATTVSYGPSSSNKHITTYFRHTFQVADPAAYQSLNLKLLVDDGAVIYLNGGEVVRRNMPAGVITSSTLALDAVGAPEETTFFNYNVSANKLVAGDNVIAVEIHQSDANSSDLSFDLGLTATSYTGVSTVDSVTYPIQVDDVSFGRNPANTAQWVSFSEPTPKALNGGGLVSDLRIGGGKVTVSSEGGFHTSPLTATLSAPSGTIHYTLDGSTPKSSSPVYTAPLSLSAPTKVLRARVIEPGKPMGPIATRTYFFNETQRTVPFVSLVADPNTLFGNQIGIYSNLHEPTSTNYGLNDVYKGKDAPGSIEFFETDGTPGFRATAGFRIGGENNWVHPQKALNVFLRGKYGDDAVSYDLFPGSTVGTHSAFTLRDGGDNWNKDMLRDGIIPLIAKDYLKVDAAEYRPSVVFINGTYYGIHDIRARWDDTWFAHAKQADPAKVDHLLYGHVDSSSVTLGIEKGNSDDWADLLAFLNTADLTNATNWAFVESRIDIDSFIDFVVMESYTNNTSWFHNREFWRERKAGAKWRWFLTDMDRGFYTSSLNAGVLADMLANEDVLKRLKLNTGFKQRLAQRYAAHMASTLKPARIIGIVSQMDTEVAAEVARHVTRWSPNGTTASIRATHIQQIKDYATQREAPVFTELAAQLGVSPTVNLTLTIDGAPGGRVLLNGVPVDGGVIRMFPNAAFEMKAAANPGFIFTGWTGITGGETVNLTLTGAQSITANFAASGETVIGGTISSDTTLSLAGSPYTLSDDLIVAPNTTLTLAAGVILKMPAARNLRVQGALQVAGSALAPVSIIGRTSDSWGGISFENPTAPSLLSHLIVRGATRGIDPVRHPAAISGLNADLVMEWLDIDDCRGPVFTRGGSTVLRDSTLHTAFTGDCINVKFGLAETRDCVFTGGNSVDTDAIDYDGVANGIIANNRIYQFRGSNSDGVDIGEGCTNVLIEGNLIYFNSDKGVSVGQGSTAVMRRNLIVGCDLGVGVKDAGSVVTVDQNTFVSNTVGVSAYEKNFGVGGGTAVVENTIFSNSAATPMEVDALSSVSIGYSLSDTVALAGTGNLLSDPRFVDPALLNFQLQPSSPAINAGNPAHAPDPDSSVADIGALYQYSASHFPYTIGETVVIEEVYANSGSTSPDWIELHNRTNAVKDISGWFLSDSAADLTKYRIPAGTILPPGGHVAFYEDVNFGIDSLDPGRITPFALSDVGETVYLSSAVNDELTDYQSKEDFGASMEGVSLGNYYKPSTDSWNFVALRVPTPGLANSGPQVGPVVVSEIMFQPPGHKDSEYFELLNVSAAPVILYDPLKAAAWKITDGIDYDFSTSVPITLAAGERIVLTKNLVRFNAAFTKPPGTRVFEWASGSLANEGETLQIAQPAGVDGLNVRQFARVDRVNYSPDLPWPGGTAGAGSALTKIAEREYGNDFVNWSATTASPGGLAPGPQFASWILTSGVPVNLSGASDDPDLDGLGNLLEFALGLDPAVSSAASPIAMGFESDKIILDFGIRLDRPGLDMRIEKSPDLAPGSWLPVDSTPLMTSGGIQQRQAEIPMVGHSKSFFRMIVTEP